MEDANQIEEEEDYPEEEIAVDPDEEDDGTDEVEKIEQTDPDNEFFSQNPQQNLDQDEN